MKTIEADVIVFDLDGTLIDSKQDIANALNWTFEELGYDPLPMKTIEGFVGNGVAPLIRKSVRAAGHEDREQEVLELFRGRYWDHLLDYTRPYDTVVDTLESFRDRYKMGLVSNKPERYTKRIVKELGLSWAFGDSVYGGDSLPVKKPDPAALLEISDRYNSPTDRMVMVGDSGVDAKTAKAAGAEFVGVTYGFRDVAELKEAGAVMFIDKFEKLKDLLK